MSNQQYSSIGSDNGLAPAKQQTIIWINDGRVWWHIYASLSINELICWIVLYITKDTFPFWLISWVWLDPSRWNLYLMKRMWVYIGAMTCIMDRQTTYGGQTNRLTDRGTCNYSCWCSQSLLVKEVPCDNSSMITARTRTRTRTKTTAATTTATIHVNHTNKQAKFLR